MSIHDIPINSLGQCWGAVCPHQIGELLWGGDSAREELDTRSWISHRNSALLSPLHPFQTYPKGATGLFDLATGRALAEASEGDAARGVVVGAMADWGTGTCEAKVVASLMASERANLTLHLGDVYLYGTPEEFENNVMGRAPSAHQVGVSWPKGEHTSFFMNGNHEYISGCNGLMVNGFDYTGQHATYGVWQSDSWRLIALDTAYGCGTRNGTSWTENAAPMPDEVVEWLIKTVRLDDPTDHRGVVLFTHHQPYSDFETAYLAAAQQLNKIIPNKKSVVWFFGHEHRLAFYQPISLSGVTDFTLYPRMVGNGGYMDDAIEPRENSSLVAYDKRLYQKIPLGKFPSPEDHPVTFNGYFTLSINDRQMDVKYVTGKCHDAGCDLGYNSTVGSTVATESFTVNLGTGELSHKWTRLKGHGLTMVNEPRDAALVV